MPNQSHDTRHDDEVFQYTTLIGSPAYGRDYDTKEEIEADWLANKDFRNRTPGVRGSYFNKADAETFSVDEVILSNRDKTVLLAVKL